MDSIWDLAWVWLWGAAGFLCLWPVSLLRRDASIVDFWWGPGIGVMALVAWAAAGLPRHGHALLMLGLLLLWSLRLGIQLGRRRLRESGEDPRYAALRRSWSPGFWWKSLFMVFLLQAVLQGLIAAAPLMAIGAAPAPLGPLAILAAALALAGILIETVADTELDRFRRAAPHRSLLQSGLRAHLRYPNYLGEILAWTGLSLLALSAGIGWAPVSAAIVFLLLWKVSGVPVLDQHLAATRPEFGSYRARVPALLPRLRPGPPAAPAATRPGR
jgi:steroid 5-alpha reductase family enzyme